MGLSQVREGDRFDGLPQPSFEIKPNSKLSNFSPSGMNLKRLRECVWVCICLKERGREKECMCGMRERERKRISTEPELDLSPLAAYVP